MEQEGLLPLSQRPDTGPYPEADVSTFSCCIPAPAMSVILIDLIKPSGSVKLIIANFLYPPVTSPPLRPTLQLSNASIIIRLLGQRF